MFGVAILSFFVWQHHLCGITGVFLSDVPANTTAHGSFFVLAHFHNTIMGRLILAFFGARCKSSTADHIRSPG